MADEWGEDQQEQEWSFDSEGYSPDDLGGGGETVKAEGWYHFEISDVKPELETLSVAGKVKAPAICFHLTVQQTVENQSPAGSRLYHRIYLGTAKESGVEPPAEGSVKSALRFGLGLGILQAVQDGEREVIIDPATKTTKITSNLWLNAKGKQCVAKVRFEKGKGSFEDKYTIPFGRVYHPNDPEVAEVQKNAEVLMLGGYSVNRSLGAAVKPTPAKNQKAPPADEDLSDL